MFTQMRSNLKFIGTILFALVFLMGGVLVTKSAQAADLTVVSNPTNASYYDAVVKTADRLVSIQSTDGSWDWIVTNATNPASKTYLNITGVTAEGLLSAYKITGKQVYLDAAKKAGDFIVSGIDASSPKMINAYNILFLQKLSTALNDSNYAVKAAEYFNTIYSVTPTTVCPSGCTDTAGLVVGQKTVRNAIITPQGIVLWDLLPYVEYAQLVEDTTRANEVGNAIVAEVMNVSYADTTPNYDLGLAAALKAAKLINDSTNVANISTKLITTDGSFGKTDDGKIQTTSYALRAFKLSSDSRTDAAATYIMNMTGRISTGGWINTDGSEYAEIDSEAITALADLLPQEIKYYTIQDAVNAANDGDTINIADGTYIESGQIIIDKNLSIVGANKETTIIKPAQNTTAIGHADSAAWILVNSDKTFNLSNVTLDGTGKSIAVGIFSHGHGTINNNIFTNIKYTNYVGIGVELYGSDMTISNNNFSNIERIGVFNGNGTNSIISGNTYTGKGEGTWLDYAFEVGRNGHATISNNIILNNKGIASDTSTSSGILVTSYYNPETPSNATITGNTISNSTDGIAVGYDEADASIVVAHNNKFSGNTHSINSTHPEVNAESNWWGITSGPATGTIIGSVDSDPWYTNATMTVLSNSQTEQYASETTTTLDSDTTSVVLDTGSSSVKEIIVPDTIPSTQEITLDMSSLLVDSSNSVTLGSNDMTLERQGTNNYSALLPAGTVITGDSNWDGNLILPTITTLTSSTGTVNVAVEMGSTQRLNFSEAVKIILGGMAGKSALYSDGTGEHTIPACIDASDTSAGSLTTGGECSITVGSDLIIWTYHFTTFAAYTPTPSHGSSGSYIKPVTPAVPAKVETPDGCAAGNKFSTTTGRNCNAATPAVPAGQVLGASTQVGKVLGAEKFNFIILVKNNSKGNEVIELQKFLTTFGYTLIADGNFGPKTKNAVIKFQIANGLKGDGVIGALTRSILNK